MRGSGNPISLRIFQFVVIYTVKGFGIVNKAEVDVFLEFSCFLDDPTDVGNLISGSSAFSKSSLKVYWVPQEEQNSPKSMDTMAHGYIGKV